MIRVVNCYDEFGTQTKTAIRFNPKAKMVNMIFCRSMQIRLYLPRSWKNWQPGTKAVDYVVAPEAMGWVLGAAVATKLGAGFAGVRKLENSVYMNQDICRVIFMDHEKQRRSFASR